MAAVDNPGAAPAARPMLGPYWRRKLGMTLPGEMTGPQLQRANLLRRSMGLPPAGGNVALDQGLAGQGGDAAAAQLQQAAGAPDQPQHSVEDLVNQYRQILMAGAGGAGIGDELHQLEGDVGGGAHVPQAATGMQQAIQQRMQGLAAKLAPRANVSRVALAAHRLQQGRRPILPPRKGAIPY